jgi:zinc D-Ala-D-Ala carboxypeptidase
MTYGDRTTTRRSPSIPVAGLLVVIAAIAAAVGYPLLASSSSTATSPIDLRRADLDHRAGGGGAGAAGLASVGRDGRAPPGLSQAQRPGGRARPPHQRSSEQRGALGEADGAVPNGTTVFNDELPGIANLDTALLDALRKAAADAADDGVELFVDSGWRSPEYQNQLLHAAVFEYGSEKEAARWVATPNTSAHVSGDAIDIRPFDATAWLSKRGANYGLCQIYSNEPWHYELRPTAIADGCPPMYADPTHDPRMKQ